MQSYEGFIENGVFTPKDKSVRIKGRRRVTIAVFDEVTKEQQTKEWQEFFEAICTMDKKLSEST